MAPSPCSSLADVVPTEDAVKALIAGYTNSLRPKIHDFLTKPKLPAWLPPAAVDEGTQEFYRNLNIPCVKGKPSLLLHGLGHFRNPNAKKLFKGWEHQ
jgi:hypothetical protein